MYSTHRSLTAVHTILLRNDDLCTIIPVSTDCVHHILLPLATVFRQFLCNSESRIRRLVGSGVLIAAAGAGALQSSG